MSERPSSRTIALNLEGKVSPSQFMRGVRDFFSLLRSVERDVVGGEHGIEWSVSVKAGSNLVIAHGAPYGRASFDDVARTIYSVESGLESLARGTSEPPPYFNDKALGIARDLATLAESGRDGGLERVEVRVNGTSVKLDAQAVVSVNNIRGPVFKEIGSVEGRIQTVTDRERFKIVVYDSLRDKAVRCTFENEALQNEALGAFGKRVAVMGEVTYKQDGTPIRVNARSIRVFRPIEDLPTTEQVRGLFSKAA